MQGAGIVRSAAFGGGNGKTPRTLCGLPIALQRIPSQTSHSIIFSVTQHGGFPSQPGRELMKRWIVRFIYKYLSGDPKEWHCVPGSECRIEFGEIDDGKPMFVATTLVEDGFELWIAYNNDGKWTFHCGAKYARRLAWFILWDWWIVSTWCGLKRKLWYWSNSEMLNMMRWGKKR